MRWESAPPEVWSILACSMCGATPLLREKGGIKCPNCSTLFDIAHDGCVPILAASVYSAAQTQTLRTGRNQGKIRARALNNLLQVFDTLVRAPLRSFFLKDSQCWEQELDFARSVEQSVLLGLMEKQGIRRARILMELGVGGLDHSLLYSQLSEYVVCSDIYIDSRSVSRYVENERVLYCVMNGDSIPIAESTVDIVITSHVLEHLPFRERSLDQMWDILKPGGLACHVVPTIGFHLTRHLVGFILNRLTFTARLFDVIHGEYDSRTEELAGNTTSAWKRLFEKHGFSVCGDAPGVFQVYPFRPEITNLLSHYLPLSASHVFVTQKGIN